MAQYATPRPAPSYQQPLVHNPPVGYKAPQPVEVYILSDHANASIPPEIREQFQRDEQGRVLFFTAPPVNASPIVQKEGQALGHSASYLAAKAKRDAKIAAKRKADAESAAEREAQVKKACLEAEEKLKKDMEQIRIKAIRALEDQLAMATKMDFEMLGGGAESAETLSRSLDRLAVVQEAAITKKLEREARLRAEKGLEKTVVTGMTARLEEKI